VFRDKGADIGGHALAVTPDGICEITSKGGVVWLDAAYWAIGSGYPFALGYMQGRSAAGTCPIDAALAVDAINFAATLVNNVGDGHQVEHLG
jgi:ATP-dependent protease HslVU (ClpYQ) peptidase subunit